MSEPNTRPVQISGDVGGDSEVWNQVTLGGAAESQWFSINNNETLATGGEQETNWTEVESWDVVEQ